MSVKHDNRREKKDNKNRRSAAAHVSASKSKTNLSNGFPMIGFCSGTTRQRCAVCRKTNCGASEQAKKKTGGNEDTSGGAGIVMEPRYANDKRREPEFQA